MNNGQGLSVRQSCGGYNCRHEWAAVPEEMTDEEAGGVAADKAQEIAIGSKRT